MVDIPLEVLQMLYFQLKPGKIITVDYCVNQHPLYITEEHCPPRRAPEIPRRE
jgi:hypothetical protein